MLKGILFFLTVWRLADGLSVVSQSGQVLAFFKHQDNEIQVASIPLVVCGDTKTCKYSVENGKCAKKGQYMTGVTADEGKGIVSSCCVPEKAGTYHDDDDCRKVTANSFTKVDAAITGDREYVKSIEKSPTGGYTMTVCKPQCGAKKPQQQEKKSQPQTQQEQPKQEPAKGAPKHKCFSADMTVQTPLGTKRMDQVRAGDHVLVMYSSDSQPIYEPIEWLYHRDPSVETDFIVVRTSSERTLRLSANHLIPIVPCSARLNSTSDWTTAANSYSKFAQKLRRGHCVGVLMENERQIEADLVLDVTSERSRGIFSPITASGTIVVNGVYVSCYSSFESHQAQHTIHNSLIKGYRLVSTIWGSVFGGGELMATSSEDPSIPTPLRALLKMAKLVVPSNVYGY